MSTFDHVGHRELEEPFTIVPGEFLEHLPGDAGLELRDFQPVGELDAAFIEPENVIKSVELIERLIEQGCHLRDKDLAERLESVGEEVGELYVAEPLVSRNINVQTQ